MVVYVQDIITKWNIIHSMKWGKDMSRIKLTILILAVVVVGVMAYAAIYYTTQFSLVLNGEKNMSVGLNSVYEEQGATALQGGRDASGEVEIRGDVDTSVPGEYEIIYTIGNLRTVRTVTVLDKMDPEILLEDVDQQQTVKLGSKFTEPGYRAFDSNGKDITDRVKVSGADFVTAGINKVEYTVKDDDGKTTKVTRSVKVKPCIDYSSAGLPICMYHYVYDENNPPEDLERRYGNYISEQDLNEELEWLNDEGYYYPSWKEVREYIDGERILPEKSIVLCFDDGALTFLENGIPVLEKNKVPATCFMITSENGAEKIKKYSSDYVSYESHSDNMHREGGVIGHGGIFTALSEDEGLADLRRSIEICGSSDAFAYPYGDYTVQCRNVVEKAGFLCGVTTEYGKARPGNDPYLLPRVRMVMGQSLDSFINQVSP